MLLADSSSLQSLACRLLSLRVGVNLENLHEVSQAEQHVIGVGEKVLARFRASAMSRDVGLLCLQALCGFKTHSL